MLRQTKAEAHQTQKIMTLGELINQLAQKAGVAASDQNLVNVLSHAELSKINVHSDLSNALDNNLLSLEIAKDNHPEIGSIYKAQALNALDKKLDTLAGDLGLSEDDSYKTLKNSYKKLDLVVEKLKETKKPDGKASEGLQKQVDQLVAELKAVKETAEKEKTDLENARINDKKDYVLKGKFAGIKTILDQLDPEVRHTSLMTALNKKLQEHDAELKFDEGGNLVAIKKDGSRLLGANHTPIDLQSILDQTIAQNKLAVVTPPQPGPTPGDRRVVPPAGASGTNSTVASYARQQREAFAANAQ